MSTVPRNAPRDPAIQEPTEFIKSLGTEIIKINVGPENQPYTVHKSLLEKGLPLFAAKYLDGLNDVSLPTVLPAIFDLLMTHLYMDVQQIRAISDRTDDEMDRLTADIETYTRLYGFAESLGETALQNVAMIEIFHGFNDQMMPNLNYDLVYKVTTPDSPLRTFAARHYVWKLLHLQQWGDMDIHAAENPTSKAPSVVDCIDEADEAAPTEEHLKLVDETTATNLAAHKAIADRIPDFNNDIWTALSKFSWTPLPPFAGGVSQFYKSATDPEIEAWANGERCIHYDDIRGWEFIRDYYGGALQKVGEKVFGEPSWSALMQGHMAPTVLDGFSPARTYRGYSPMSMGSFARPSSVKTFVEGYVPPARTLRSRNPSRGRQPVREGSQYRTPSQAYGDSIQATARLSSVRAQSIRASTPPPVGDLSSTRPTSPSHSLRATGSRPQSRAQCHPCSQIASRMHSLAPTFRIPSREPSPTDIFGWRNASSFVKVPTSTPSGKYHVGRY
ncbi:hypothetical protein B0J14DRAFT_574115 [Halenospora varia]|nr:hypothetical protein B0J14DRAFT_574115 [Halenospora varia]